MPTLVRTFITEDADDVATVEPESEAKWLDFDQANFLTEEVMQEERRKAVFICVVPPNGAALVCMLKLTLDADPSFVEVELDSPPSDADLLKLGADEEVEFWSVGERVHPDGIGNPHGTGNVRFPPVADIRRSV